MKVQWQLIEVETGEPVVKVAPTFEIVDYFKGAKGDLVHWGEACLLFGDPSAISETPPRGIMNWDFGKNCSG